MADEPDRDYGKYRDYEESREWAEDLMARMERREPKTERDDPDIARALHFLIVRLAGVERRLAKLEDDAWREKRLI
jgi:hypothetical protein